MKKLTALLIPVMMVAGMATAVAAEKKGHISEIDLAAGTMALSNWNFTLPEGVETGDLAVGDNVKVYFKVRFLEISTTIS